MRKLARSLIHFCRQKRVKRYQKRKDHGETWTFSPFCKRKVVGGKNGKKRRWGARRREAHGKGGQGERISVMLAAAMRWN